ncbi:hypothetical protein ACFXG4_30670 [Nocardia sp. NPDC059246]|uniref:hypothetical protein n=1 Tax=unclassified Nocardia TaxID=2637762 RepID=UPI0036961198
MSDPRKIDSADMVQVLWPTDGPYTAERVIAAASAIAELWRYLARATRLDVFDQPADAYVMVGNLLASARSATQMFVQLRDWAVYLKEDADLAHDAARYDQERAITTAAVAAEWLFAASGDMSLLAQALDKATAELGHLYIDRDDAEGAGR